jgi:hypothetical protein
MEFPLRLIPEANTGEAARYTEFPFRTHVALLNVEWNIPNKELNISVVINKTERNTSQSYINYANLWAHKEEVSAWLFYSWVFSVCSTCIGTECPHALFSCASYDSHSLPHLLLGICNADAGYFHWGTNWILICYADELQAAGRRELKWQKETA